MLNTSLAYVLVALCYLLPEADYHVRQLGLLCPSPLERTNLTEILVAGGKERLLATVATSNYTFAFTEKGLIHSIARRNDPAKEGYIREYFDSLARQPSQLDPPGAYQLATQWLTAVDVDVKRLEKRFHHRVDYPKTDKAVRVESSGGKSRRTRIVPYFFVTWGEIGDPNLEKAAPYVVQVKMLGTTKELVSLAIDRSQLTRPVVRVPGDAVLMELPNESFTNLWAHRELSVTNVFGLLRTSTAYQAKMLRRMLDEANWTLRQLGLPTEAQLSHNDLTDSCVVPPQFGFRASLTGKISFFQFDAQGKLIYMFHTPPLPSGLSDDEHYEQMSRRPMLVDSNSVVELAAGWLSAIEVDVEELNRVSKPVVSRYMFTNKRGKKQASHIWWVNWWDPRGAGSPIVHIQVDGTTENPDRIKLFKAGYSLRPGIGITNAEELMQTPDVAPQRHPLMPHLNVSYKALDRTSEWRQARSYGQVSGNSVKGRAF